MKFNTDSSGNLIALDEEGKAKLAETAVTESKQRVQLAEGKAFAGYPGRCKECGQPVKSSKKKATTESRPMTPGEFQSIMEARGRKPGTAPTTRPTNLEATKQALKESYLLMGMSEAEAKIASGLDDPIVFGVPMSALKGGN
jgi:hypothetical protein